MFLGTFCLAEASNTNAVDYVGTYAWGKRAPGNLKQSKSNFHTSCQL